MRLAVPRAALYPGVPAQPVLEDRGCCLRSYTFWVMFCDWKCNPKLELEAPLVKCSTVSSSTFKSVSKSLSTHKQAQGPSSLLDFCLCIYCLQLEQKYPYRILSKEQRAKSKEHTHTHKTSSHSHAHWTSGHACAAYETAIFSIELVKSRWLA